MGPLPHFPRSAELFRQALCGQTNLNHALTKLANLMDWARINEMRSQEFTSTRERPAELAPFVWLDNGRG